MSQSARQPSRVRPTVRPARYDTQILLVALLSCAMLRTLAAPLTSPTQAEVEGSSTKETLGERAPDLPEPTHPPPSAPLPRNSEGDSLSLDALGDQPINSSTQRTQVHTRAASARVHPLPFGRTRVSCPRGFAIRQIVVSDGLAYKTETGDTASYRKASEAARHCMHPSNASKLGKRLGMNSCVIRAETHSVRLFDNLPHEPTQRSGRDDLMSVLHAECSPKSAELDPPKPYVITRSHLVSIAEASKDVEELSEFALPIVLRANANSTSNVEGGDAIDYQGAANSSSGSVNERKETVESTQAVASQPAEPADVLPPPIEEMRQLKNDAEETAMQDNEPADTPAEYAAWDEDEILPLEQFKQQALLKIQTDPNFHPATLDPAHAASSVVSGSTSDGREGQLGIALPWERPNVPLKDRFNYLASDAGAKVVAKAPEMKSVRDVLTEDRDKYMTCERVVKKKWITLSLIEDILLDTIVLANFEYYSSSVRKFQVLGSQSYPCHAWALLGEFEGMPWLREGKSP